MSLHAVILEIQVYKQKVKHLLYEHQNNITELKRDGAVAVTLEQSQHREGEGDLNQEKRTLKVQYIILCTLLCAGALHSSKQVRGPQHNANYCKYIETTLKQDKSEGAMAPLGPIVARPVVVWV